MLRAEFIKLTKEAKDAKTTQPFVFGSEASYTEGSTLLNGQSKIIECPTFEYEERSRAAKI